MMRCKHCGQIVKYERDYLVPDEAFNARLTIKGNGLELCRGGFVLRGVVRMVFMSY
jgi:hypothetical protein